MDSGNVEIKKPDIAAGVIMRTSLTENFLIFASLPSASPSSKKISDVVFVSFIA